MLGDKVTEVNFSANIGNVASSLLSKGAISLEMEKVLSEMPGSLGVKSGTSFDSKIARGTKRRKQETFSFRSI